MKLSQMENHIKSVCVVAERETRRTTSISSEAYKIMEFIYGQRKLSFLKHERQTDGQTYAYKS